MSFGVNKKHTSERVETDWTSCNTASDKLAASFRISYACKKKMCFKISLNEKKKCDKHPWRALYLRP